ncbi:LysR family transcriptional regulator [Specibacter cremeus]|uniref:LysR family transcriptional regulator n=1 Tax=Specibacter cremeus TaxID=1629051 RepID=UPI000F780555|nr:LysR family transcriptional regulator [Specibacter cremeus]
MRDDYADLVKLLPVLPLLAELGSSGQITATAELLGIPQPTVSRALSRAAAVVGTPLITRQGRGVRLTPAALALIPHVNAALDRVQEGLAEARAEAGRSYGRIGIAFQHTFGEATLPMLLQRFTADHPGVRFDLQQGSRAFCLDALDAGTADFAVVAPVPDPTRARPTALLYTEELMLVVPGGHRLAGRDGVALAEVRADKFIMLESGYGLRSIVEQLCKDAGFRPRIAFEGQDAHTVRGLVSAGLGVSILPPTGPAHLTPRRSGLGWRELRIDEPPARRGIGLVWRNRPDEPGQVARFRDLVLTGGREVLQAAFGRG